MNGGVEPGSLAHPRDPRMVSVRIPQFLIVRESRSRAFWDSVVAVWKAKPPVNSLSLTGRRKVWTDRRRLGSSVFSSFVLHFAVVFFFVEFPFSALLATLERSRVPVQLPTRTYELRTIKLSDYFPALNPGGAEPRPARVEVPVRRSTRTDPRLRIISSPANPDNDRQTIVQPSSPPNLRIAANLALPNVILGGIGSTRPVHTALQVRNDPRRAATPIPAPELRLTPSPSPSAVPALPVASSAVPDLAPQPVQEPQPGPMPAVGSAGGSMDTLHLAVISVEPAPPVDSIKLPSGQRFGRFTISAADPGPGAPTGAASEPAGATAGATPSSGAAAEASGDTTAGTSRGGHGGTNAAGPGYGTGAGHGDGNTEIPVSTNTEPNGEPGLSAEMILNISKHIYPVVAPPHAGYRGIVVTAGPQGGGGLHLYGILRGGKIYTSYLLMPGRNWILEYSAHDGTPTDSAPSRGVKVQLDSPLVAPVAQEQFDFDRSAFPPGRTGDMIVLRGWIRADGSLDKIAILKGFNGATDRAALVTFRKWKFTPAMRAGKPVEVEILVGIPANCPACR